MKHRMSQVDGILDSHATFDPSSDFEAFLKQTPAKWAVYLLADADDQPVQLLCVKNLRYSLKRRLGLERLAPDEAAPETVPLSRKIDYRQIVRNIHWRRVDSAFEADLIYYEIARQVFPQTYQGMVGFRPAWFIHVDPDAKFPRYTKTIKPGEKPGIYFGPVEDKHAAARLMELIEDAFDLCRYYNVLIEAPHGRACAYKEMGKCPAPCDGSISMDQYRRMIEWSAKTLADPREMIHDQTDRMKQAAADLHFEIAAKIQAFIKQISQIGKGAFRHAHPLDDLAYVTIQPGHKTGCAKVFLILRGFVEELADFTCEPIRPSELLRTIFTVAEDHADEPLDDHGTERIGIVARHLFSPKQSQGVFLPLSDLADPSGRALLKAYKSVANLPQQEVPDVEGILKELQAM
jgi:excinuclease UvrABC nuclease subunit